MAASSSSSLMACDLTSTLISSSCAAMLPFPVAPIWCARRALVASILLVMLLSSVSIFVLAAWMLAVLEAMFMLLVPMSLLFAATPSVFVLISLELPSIRYLFASMPLVLAAMALRLAPTSASRRPSFSPWPAILAVLVPMSALAPVMAAEFAPMRPLSSVARAEKACSLSFSFPTRSSDVWENLMSVFA